MRGNDAHGTVITPTISKSIIEPDFVAYVTIITHFFYDGLSGLV